MSMASATPQPVPGWADSHMVPMRDGVRLATDVYKPQDTGKPQDAAALPAVLVRLPYDKNSRYVFMEEVGRRLVARGYALVVQDVRGKFRSEGEALGLVGEAWDGYDTIEWIVRQEWSGGRVGMFGDSYYGFTQWAAVSTSHPALRAIVPRVTAVDMASFTPVAHGSVLDPPWSGFAAYIAECWNGPWLHEPELDWTRTPLTEVFEEAFRRRGRRSSWYDRSIPEAKPVTVFPDGHPFDARPVPTLHVVGWHDNVLLHSMRDYLELTSRPGHAPMQYLYADSIDHENYHLSLVPIQEEDDHESDDAALGRMLDRYLDPAIDFFDAFLAETAPAETVPRVRWHLGHAGWRRAGCWPPEESAPYTLYLAGLTAAEGAGTGRLAPDPPAREESVSWDHDPGDLVPSAAENSFEFLRAYPDERDAGDRPDVLRFDTAAFGDGLDLAGPIDLHLRVDSTAPTADVYAKLYDVAPGGACHMISRGQGVLTEPGAAEPARIEMTHTGYRVRPGHRLRLHVAGSDYPEFAPNPGTRENPWTAEHRRGSRQTLRTSPDMACRLVLRALPGAG
ncbi:CocE/NonD family hydrolase [Actinomadura sp. 9N407]|uniref:CocE/NonD family hydrolase n=1 Tax=Actinomadura sp. 9N407 TaxID=3375154 RepID=UPI003795AC6E